MNRERFWSVLFAGVVLGFAGAQLMQHYAPAHSTQVMLALDAMMAFGAGLDFSRLRRRVKRS